MAINENLLEIVLKSEKKICVGFPPPPPPPLSDFFRAGAKFYGSRSSSETFLQFCPPPQANTLAPPLHTLSKLEPCIENKDNYTNHIRGGSETGEVMKT